MSLEKTVKLCIRSKFIRHLRQIAWLALLGMVACGGNSGQEKTLETELPGTARITRLNSLQDLSVESLRARQYSSKPVWVANLAGSSLLAYDSDGLRIYSRMDVPPGPPPAAGYPVLVFVHGWVGREAAPEFDFMTAPDSQTAQLIKAYVAAGFVVLSPGLRGHGSADGLAAEGVEYLDAWDNASYLSPIYYAIDVLNLVAGIPSLESMGRPDSEHRTAIRIDLGNIHIQGHSQGADAVLTALAVSGEGSGFSPALASGSLWSGCFGPRLEQAAIYGPMATTLQAFMSGDGSWTGTAIGHDGSVNADFVFGYPPDWIATVDVHSPEWAWQADNWSVPTVAMALEQKYSEMYAVINAGVADIGDARFSLERDAAGKTVVLHDPRIVEVMSHIGGYDKPQFLTEPIQFHYSDQDYYSPPEWNEDLAARIISEGGSAAAFVYPKNNHSLRISQYPWFSHGEVREGFSMMLRRDIAMFLNGDKALLPGKAAAHSVSEMNATDDQLSIAALREYAAEISNEFEVVRELQALNGMPRRELTFTTDGLRQYALLIQPAGDMPPGGWPVLLMNHGYHPDPHNYGRIADGTTDRPGDYYRGIPPLFAKRGFLVVVPDYRGHNDSEGAEYTSGILAPYWYSRDVVSAFRSLASLPQANLKQAFMWGHSMGGPITLRALLALGDEVQAASIWSSGSAWLQSRNAQQEQEWQQELQLELDSLFFNFSPNLSASGSSLGELMVPVLIHHAEEDKSTSPENSQAIAKALSGAGKDHEFFLYQGADHLFTAENLQQAVDRDVDYFRREIERSVEAESL
jgi:dienelactone hydrolase